MEPMTVYAAPRNIPARYLQEGDLVATHIIDDRRRFVRDADYVARWPQVITWCTVKRTPAIMTVKQAKKAGAPEEATQVESGTVLGVTLAAVAPVQGDATMFDTDREQVVMRQAVRVDPTTIVQAADQRVLEELTSVVGEGWAIDDEGYIPAVGGGWFVPGGERETGGDASE